MPLLTTSRRVTNAGYRPNTYRSRGCKKVWVASPSRDFAPNKYERTGQLQLLHKSYHDGLPAEKLGPDGEPSFANGCDRTQQLYVPRYNSLIGNTPLVDLSALSENPKVRILGKCEFMNPSASIKDRIAQHIVMEAERTGKLKPGGTVVAATSGNTGSAVAMMCAMRGYKYIGTDCVIQVFNFLIRPTAAYGGKVIVAPCGVPADDPMHYQNMASTLCKENPDYFDVDQYDNPNNPEAYYRSLGPEIWEQSQGQVTHFVAGGSTGGTISGTGRYLKEASNGQVKVVMPDPVGSVFWDYFMNKVEECELSPKSYQVEGVGKDSIPGAMNFQVVDEMVQVTDKQAFQLCRRVANTEGMLVGGSAGLNLHAAVELSRKIDEGVIVAILCDSGIKYLSKIYCDEWMVAKGFMDGEDPQADAMEYVPVCGTAHLMKEGAAVASSLSAAASPPMQASAAAVSAESADRVLQKVADKLVRYVAEVNDRTQPVVELASPDELKAAFASAGVPLSLATAAAPASEEQLMSAVDQTLKYSVKTGHPMFFNQLYARADPVSIAGDWLTIAANTNVHTYEVAPVFTVVEVEVLAKMAQLVGGAYAQAHEGLFVPGGSLSNLYGMHLARNRACPELRSKGAAGGPTLVAFTSDQAHYSYKKGAMLSGIGTDNLVAVETDERGQMRPDALERAIVAAKDAGKMPFFVGATAGTTVLGAFDPFAELADVCERHGVWLHIDGCWGASVLVSERLRHLMAGCERADSIAWNAHKMMGLPLQCSAFLNRHPGALMAANASNAAYLFQPDKLNTEYDLGDRTIQCGRKADAFKLWLAWKAYGDAGYAERVEHCFRLAEHFERAVASSNGSLVLAYPRNCTNVCFWVVPRSMRPFDPATAPQQQLNRIAQVAPAVKNLMQRKGDAMIGFQPVGGLPNFFRIVFANAWIVTVAELDAMVERMVAYADELFP